MDSYILSLFSVCINIKRLGTYFHPIYFTHLLSAEYIYLIQTIVLIHIQLGFCIILVIDQIPTRLDG